MSVDAGVPASGFGATAPTTTRVRGGDTGSPDSACTCSSNCTNLRTAMSPPPSAPADRGSNPRLGGVRRPRNAPKCQRAAVAIFDPASPYESVQVQGTASIEDDPGGTLIDELSHKYTGGPYPGFAGPNPQWVIARITADKVATSW